MVAATAYRRCSIFYSLASRLREGSTTATRKSVELATAARLLLLPCTYRAAAAAAASSTSVHASARACAATKPCSREVGMVRARERERERKRERERESTRNGATERLHTRESGEREGNPFTLGWKRERERERTF